METNVIYLLPYIHMPVICMFGVITNGLNVIAFLNSQMKDSSFKYMLVISICDLVYLVILSYQFIYYCEECAFNKGYLLQIYTLFFDQYLTRCIAVFNILAEIALSIQRYMVLINRQFLRKQAHNWLLFGLFVFSLVYYMPLLFFKEIIEIQNNSTREEYTLKYNQLGESSLGEIVPIVLTSIRICLGTFVLTAINLINVFVLRNRFNHSFSTESNISIVHDNHSAANSSSTYASQRTRGHVTHDNVAKIKASRNITLMVVWTSIIFILGNTPYLVSFILGYALHGITSDLKTFQMISLSIIYLAHSLNIFVYYFYNKLFRQILKSYFRRILCLKIFHY